MILTRNMFIDFSCYFHIDQGHSDHFKWYIVQTEASPGKPRSKMGYRFSGSGLKRGLKNHTFWSEIGSGFWEPCGTPPPKMLGSTSPPGRSYLLHFTREMLFPWQDPRVAYLSVGVSPPRPLHHECTSLLHLSWPSELPVWVYEPYLPADLKQGMDLSGEHSYLTSSTCIKHKGSLYKWWLEGQRQNDRWIHVIWCKCCHCL